MRTHKIASMVGMALEYKERIVTVEDVWAAEEALADYLENVEKNLNDDEWFYFDEIYETMKKLRDAVMVFTNEAWDSIMLENRTGQLHLFENGHVGSKHDVDAQNMDSLYSITLDWVEWEDAAVANEDGSKNYEAENGFKGELMEHLYNIVLTDYFEQWLDHIDDTYAKP